MEGYRLLLLLPLCFYNGAASKLANFKQFSSLTEFFQNQAENKTFLRLHEEHLKHFQDDRNSLKASPGAPFTCRKVQVPLGPKTVHSLSPEDVRVVAALGDSITAGTGITAKTVVGELISERGLSWSIGGEGSVDSVDTLANMLKVFNPDITGYSTGSGPQWWEPTSHLNVAKPGAKSKDMYGQAKLLVKRMKQNSKINYATDWKVITIFIGGNDLCDFCEDKVKYGAEAYKANLQKALDHLHAQVPRAFVNLVQILPITIVKDLNKNLICEVFHWFGCRCAAYPHDSKAEADLAAETQKYRDVLQELVVTGRYDTKDDFTVILQPFFTNTYPPKKPDGEIDLSYFAPDCFHLSLKGHAAAADALWNNMVEPVGKKRIEWMTGEVIECLTNSKPYFYTYKNSNKSYETVKETRSYSDYASSYFDTNNMMDSISSNDELEKRNNGGHVSIATAIGIAMAALVVLVIIAIFGVAIYGKKMKRAAYKKLPNRVAVQ